MSLFALAGPIYLWISAGTCIELFYAKYIGKKTVTICEIEDPSPWIIAYSDIILKRIEELEDCLRRMLKSGL